MWALALATFGLPVLITAAPATGVARRLEDDHTGKRGGQWRR
jgi:hypothetical protein